MNDALWYKNAVFYQVYIRAFADGNGDGHGDLRGLIDRLDYVCDLGVDCLWLMPMYPSPLKDDGYDIADYYNIHPDYGTLDDFKTFLAEAHRRGIRVILDMVLNHTFDQHPWFLKSRSNRDGGGKVLTDGPVTRVSPLYCPRPQSALFESTKTHEIPRSLCVSSCGFVEESAVCARAQYSRRPANRLENTGSSVAGIPNGLKCISQM